MAMKLYSFQRNLLQCLVSTLVSSLVLLESAERQAHWLLVLYLFSLLGNFNHGTLFHVYLSTGNGRIIVCNKRYILSLYILSLILALA
jgi:hypothetical protein